MESDSEHLGHLRERSVVEPSRSALRSALKQIENVKVKACWVVAPDREAVSTQQKQIAMRLTVERAVARVQKAHPPGCNARTSVARPLIGMVVPTVARLRIGCATGLHGVRQILQVVHCSPL